MAKLFVIMGKSSTGKDTVYKELLKSGSLKPIVMYTTRPMREGETDGKEYFFTTDKDVEAYQAENKIIEMRSYNTIQGLWRYYTLDDGHIAGVTFRLPLSTRFHVLSHGADIIVIILMLLF